MLRLGMEFVGLRLAQLHRGLQPQHLHLELEYLRQPQQLLQSEQRNVNNVNRNNVNANNSTGTTSTPTTSTAITSTITAPTTSTAATTTPHFNQNLDQAQYQKQEPGKFGTTTGSGAGNQPNFNQQTGAISRIGQERIRTRGAPEFNQNQRQPERGYGQQAGRRIRQERLQQLRPGREYPHQQRARPAKPGRQPRRRGGGGERVPGGAGANRGGGGGRRR